MASRSPRSSRGETELADCSAAVSLSKQGDVCSRRCRAAAVAARAVPGRAASQQLIEQHAQRVDIRSPSWEACLPSVQGQRSLVSSESAWLALPDLIRAEEFGNAEVEQFHRPSVLTRMLLV